ncbi:MAG: AtpZ/AtpI family protein [bacterium]
MSRQDGDGMKKPGGKADGPEEEWKTRRSIGLYSGIPWTLVAGLLIGYGLGSLLERKYHTGGVLLGVTMLFCVGVALYSILRTIIKESDK